MREKPISEIIKQKFELLKDEFDERSRRLWSASETLFLGHGGIITVAKATGLAKSTVQLGVKELKARKTTAIDSTSRRIRKSGGGRKPLVTKDSNLLSALDALVEPTARGDPMSPLRWTCKSTRNLSKELKKQGHKISHTKVLHLLESLGYSLQKTRKTREGSSHPDRNSQFEYINKQTKCFQDLDQPVISVDTKKKELVGDYANNGQEFQPKGQPEEVQVHDFPDPVIGKAIPYGVYDVTANSGWVSVGSDHDTAEFAVQTIRQWWYKMGIRRYPQATELLITADGGGSNGRRCRLWKWELQHLANETGLSISVCHFPPGTSKWNKIEHRMFSHITANWRGRALVSHEVIVNLIAQTTTRKGLKIEAELDDKEYAPGRKIGDDDLKKINLQLASFHGMDWNYTIGPNMKK